MDFFLIFKPFSTISLTNDWPCFEHDSQNWTFLFKMSQRIEHMTWLKVLIELFKNITQRIECFFEYDSQNWTTLFEYDSKNWTFLSIFVFLTKKNSQIWTLFNMAQRKWTGFPKFDSKNWTLFTKGLKELDPKRLFDSHNKTFLWLEELNFFFVFESKKLSFYFQIYDSNYWTFSEQNSQNWTPLKKYDSQNRTFFEKYDS